MSDTRSRPSTPSCSGAKQGSTLDGGGLFGFATAALAGKPLVLNDQQMDVITAGSATAATALQSSARGRNATLSTMVGNIAVDLGSASLAQSRGSVLGTGASVSADIYSLASANPFEASAASTGTANGRTATISAFAMSTAVSAARIGATQALSSTTSFSSGRSR
jgi:hypothetical protein